MNKYYRITTTTFFILICFQIKSQNLYFPPVSNAANWETTSPASLGWCIGKIDTLYRFLESENTKGFIVLKDGKIVLEKYFGTFTQDSIWYWASAGKTMTAFLVGQAQESGLLKVSDLSSKYLGKGWTKCTPAQEDKITVRHQLTMTTGLDDGVPDNHCLIDTCLKFKADAGKRWAYHNAPYTLLEKVLTSASGQPINTFTQQKLKNQTGITGSWFTLDYDNVYFSRVRSMARFGLLIQNKGIWNKDTLLRDGEYFKQMTTTSQNINLSYGYLWWLNGKPSYMVPTLQTVFPGSYAPSAPADMYSGLGKNGQIVSISPSKGIVIVRMGDRPNSAASEIATILCNQIWQKLNDIMCTTTSTVEVQNVPINVNVYPNPTGAFLKINEDSEIIKSAEIISPDGRLISKGPINGQTIDVSGLSPGVYFLRLLSIENKFTTSKFVKQ